uniref:Uncharacterized protein n=1 Tax=Rhizophora mucronata TaxID=61149 RepID=A0A2P2NL33_RHIMU
MSNCMFLSFFQNCFRFHHFVLIILSYFLNLALLCYQVISRWVGFSF